MRQRGDGKVVVRTVPDGSLIAFEDLYDIVRGIVRYEIRKYGGPEANAADRETWDRWARKFRAFMVECFTHDAVVEDLLRKYEVPDRTARTSTRPRPAPNYDFDDGWLDPAQAFR